MKEFISVNERKHTFEIEDYIQGEKVKGTFVAKFPTILDEINIDSEVAKAFTDTNMETIHLRTFNNAYMITYNETLLEQKPSWYNVDYFDDMVIVQKVFKEIAQFVHSFRIKNEELRHPKDRTKSNDGRAVESE